MKMMIKKRKKEEKFKPKEKFKKPNKLQLLLATKHKIIINLRKTVSFTLIHCVSDSNILFFIKKNQFNIILISVEVCIIFLSIYLNPLF
jgi:hypothetical protein